MEKDDSIENNHMEKHEKNELPIEVAQTIDRMNKAGFEAYAVGGAVRDMLRGVTPKDWDIATNARPEEIQKVFPKSFYANTFGTVTVHTASEEPSLRQIEITTYRKDGDYSDNRHPDRVDFSKTLEEDLKRRDFTVNAMAFDGKNIIDLFGGQKDVHNKIIRAVGNPDERFAKEDALRMIRAERFATTLGYGVEENTRASIQKNSELIKNIAQERISQELLKIIGHENAADGIRLMKDDKLLLRILPELLEGDGMEQNKHHIYTVLEHNLRSLDYAAHEGFSEDVRLAALLHDIGKARTKTGEGPESHFYSHEIASTDMAYQLLRRMKFPNAKIVKITKLIRYHMFNYDPDEVTDSMVRRVIASVGKENINELIDVRIADRIGSGCAKPEPYKVRHFRYRVEKLMQDPLSVKMLKLNGTELMETLNIPPGPRVGYILNILFGEVLDDPKRNMQFLLIKRAKELHDLSDENLKAMHDEAMTKKETIGIKEDEELKEKHYVARGHAGKKDGWRQDGT